MQNQKSIYNKLFPVLLGFFIMGFCDLVGISVTYAKLQFNWSETKAGFLPSLVFLWFLLLSVPAALAMNKFGRKKLVLAGLFITLIAVFIPVVSFTETTCYITFILLGIGNTVLQVALNPLLTNIVNDKVTSYITLGQFIKAISSFTGPIIVGYFSVQFGSWEKSFYAYAAITSLSLIWLFFTKIKENTTRQETASLTKTFGLLKDSTILLCFIGILCVVGLDVGMNMVTPKLLMERVGLEKEAATYGSSYYFAARTIGTAFGIIMLSRFSEKLFFKICMLVVLLMLGGLLFVNDQTLLLTLVCIIAFASSSIFAIIYTIAIRFRPLQTNEISGLMITGVAGGAIFPPLMGLATETLGSQQGSVMILLLCALYLAICSFRLSVPSAANLNDKTDSSA
ncbi:MFS transporter [Flavobacterium psychrophilum]|nr:MFS transporter [Flavobacterium psychrophilum]AOE54101.1 MFS transporter [Flavobacterium psychrophilum]